MVSGSRRRAIVERIVSSMIWRNWLASASDWKSIKVPLGSWMVVCSLMYHSISDDMRAAISLDVRQGESCS